jgi:hypothetical protein
VKSKQSQIKSRVDGIDNAKLLDLLDTFSLRFIGLWYAKKQNPKLDSRAEFEQLKNSRIQDY